MYDTDQQFIDEQIAAFHRAAAREAKNARRRFWPRVAHFGAFVLILIAAVLVGVLLGSL